MRYHFGQLISSINQFLKISGPSYLFGCACLAASRVCQVVSFFLPLKIFIIIYSGRIPSYFNIFPEHLDIKEVITLLACLVPVLYVSSILLGIVFRWLIDRHSVRFSELPYILSGKPVSNKNRLKLHNHISKALSELMLAIMAILLACYFDIWMALIWIILWLSNFSLFYRTALQAEEHDRLTFLRLHRRQFIEYIANANFLIIFFVLSMELIYMDLGVYSAIFLLLMSRMLFQSLNRFSVESLFITRYLP